ncbi:hypothetical protein [Nautilia sp.]
MKKSVALFVTITFLFIALGIISAVLSVSKKASSSSNVYIAQNSVLIKDTLTALSEITEDINSSKKLDGIFTTFFISDEKGEFRAVYTITPLFNKIDINAFLQNGKINKNINFFLDNVLEYYEIQNPALFKDLLLDTIDTDKTEREGYSEIILNDPFFQNGKIYNFKHFELIEKYYVKITDDKNIYKVPWKKLIFFSDGSKHILECSLLNKKTAEFLGLQFNGKPTCENILTEENNQTVQNFDIIEFKNKNDFLIKINIQYFINEKKESFDIIYNIHTKKAVSIESNPVY